MELSRMERAHLRKLQAQVEIETTNARERIPAPKDVETLPAVYGVNALMEEIGKLSRCCNKLVIAADPQVRDGWEKEIKERVRTSISLLERLFIKLERERGELDG